MPRPPLNPWVIDQPIMDEEKDLAAHVDPIANPPQLATASEALPTATARPERNDVLFTQYLRPDGRRKDVWITRTPQIAMDAKRVRDAGYHFDIEMLMTGHVSMTVEPNSPDANGEDAPVAHEICENGPAVLEAVDRLVSAAVSLLAREAR